MTKPTRTLSRFAATLIAIFSLIQGAFAASGDFFGGTGEEGAMPKVAASGTLGSNVTKIIDYFLGFLGLIAVAFVIYGGVLMVTSAGNEEGVGKAKKILTYAAIGIVLIMLSYTIVTFVTSALG